MTDKISVVTSLYKSQSFIHDFIHRHVAVLKKLGLDYEIILVNDGSPDHSLNEARSFLKTVPNLKVVNLSRNFGQHAAMFAGLGLATGHYIFALDSDLEEAPENLEFMYRLIKSEKDIDVVYSVINQRTGGFVRNFLGSFFYTLMDYFSNIKIPRDQAWQRLMTKKYVEALLAFTERESLPAGLMVLAGFKQLPYRIDKIFKGTSSYSFSKRLNLAVRSIISFSSRPLILICLFGLMITLLSLLAVAFVLYLKLTDYDFQAGWSSLIISVWLIGGMILFSIGIIGLYLAKVFDQVKGRPLYWIHSIEESHV